MLNRIIKFFLHNRLFTVILMILLIGWGLIHAPFDEIRPEFLPEDQVAVDAIPNIGKNQQIVFTEWQGRSPQDIEDQITYPLTSTLLSVPGVETVRSSSMFGFSSIYVIFEEDVDFYWSRSRILEKLNSLPNNYLPEGAQPTLGPDATALGQVFWYTLEGRDSLGNPTGGWNLAELRSIQDYYVKYGLTSVKGVSEIASIGGFVKEYQVDIKPEMLKEYGISLNKVANALSETNQEVGARTIEINKVEYFVRGLGYVDSISDIEKTVVTVHKNTPIKIGDIAHVNVGPAPRRGILDKGGTEVVGGVVLARYGSNPMKVIENVKSKIQDISDGLPSKTLDDGTKSQLTIVPFYDRSHLIQETLGTLSEALSFEIIITIIVIMIMLANLRTSLLISSLLPLAVLMVFIAMKYGGVDANIVALSGIAIAIGTMVDVGIILSENIVKHQDDPENESLSLLEIIYNGAAEVSYPILTAVTTTIISFIPVFTLQAAEGKLFGPLAYTKTFALIAALLVAFLFIPTLFYYFHKIKLKNTFSKHLFSAFLIIGGVFCLIYAYEWAGFSLILLGIARLVQVFTEEKNIVFNNLSIIVIITSIGYLLAFEWLPLGPEFTTISNFLFIAIIISFILGLFWLVIRYYTQILKWCLRNATLFLSLPVLLIFISSFIWFGWSAVMSLPQKAFNAASISIEETNAWKTMDRTFPGLGREFMPSLSEGEFLLMPTSMPHAGIEENKETLRKLDMAVQAIPEVESVVGKLGRVESAIDPAPLSMYENIISYYPEYMVTEDGNRLRAAVDSSGNYVLKSGESVSIEDIRLLNISAKKIKQSSDGEYVRLWRDKINSPDDIWNEIVNASDLPGVTSAPKLQPIETRLVMLQTGMRAPMGIKVQGPDLETIEDFSQKLETILKGVPTVKKEAVFADQIIGKPYMEIKIDRDAIARYGLTIADVQAHIKTAIGGMSQSTTVEGRERYNIRLRYPRSDRSDPDALKNIYINTPTDVQIPLGEIASIEFRRGPQVIKSEDSFLIGYTIFDKEEGHSEFDVVMDAQDSIRAHINRNDLNVPKGVTYAFSGSYKNQMRAEARLSFIVPIVLLIIFLILYFQFKSVSTSMMVFAGIIVAFSGGFLMLWLYGQPWFMNFHFMGIDLQEVFNIKSINLSVAIWVGFIALFGIATDDGVIMASYLKDSFEKHEPTSRKEITEAVIAGGMKRIRPCLMTTATTLLALLPILTSTGRGADIMIPMAIPIFGGMVIALVTVLVVPVLYGLRAYNQLNQKTK